jgi:hypothetical protein
MTRCSSITSARVSGDLIGTSSKGSVMPDTVRHAQPVATPGSSKSVDNLHAEFAGLRVSDARRDLVFAPLVGNARVGAFTPEPLRAFGGKRAARSGNVRGRECATPASVCGADTAGV